MFQLKNGPFIHAIGHVTRPDFTVHTAVVPGETLTPPVLVTDKGHISTVAPLTHEQMLQPLPKEVLKASGVARARNSAKSTIYAALVAQEFNRLLSGKPGYNPDRVIVGVNNNSASTAISWEYETEGVTRGWRNTNTMLMPSALPSAMGTQISSAIKTHNATITFLNDILGMCAAMEYTHINFFHERADYAFLIASEEISVLRAKVQERKQDPLIVERDGAAGLLLCKEKPGERAWRLSLYQHTAYFKDIAVPADWQDAKILHISLPEHKTAFSPLIFPYAVYKLCTQEDSDKAILITSVENRSTCALGFQLTDR